MRKFIRRRLHIHNSSEEIERKPRSVPVESLDVNQVYQEGQNSTTLRWKASSQGNEIQLGCLKFYDEEKIIKISKISNPNGRSPWNENVENLASDSTYNKWLNFGNSATIIIEFATNAEITAFEMITANDCHDRDPVSWEIHTKSEDTGEWILVEKRSIENTPGRYSSYGKLEFNFGVEDLRKSVDGVFLRPNDIASFTPPQITEIWSSPERNKSRLPVYKNLINEICVNQKYMNTTKIQKALKHISDLLDESPLTNSFSDALTSIIAKAYNVSERNAHRQSCSLGGYSLHSCVMNLYSTLNWRQKYLHKALQIFGKTEEPSGLVGILHLLARGGAECQAR